jgi:hypothetical protein
VLSPIVATPIAALGSGWKASSRSGDLPQVGPIEAWIKIKNPASPAVLQIADGTGEGHSISSFRNCRDAD